MPEGGLIFQFLIVRLKGASKRTSLSSCRISIPYSTIKSLEQGAIRIPPTAFQFLIVRLKGGRLTAVYDAELFQFLIVRLKASKTHISHP